MDLLLDSSVLVKWFDTRDEDEVPAARALRTAHGSGRLAVHLLDLAFYELGNVLLRRRGWCAEEVAEQMQELNDVVAGVLPVSAAWTGQAATLAERYGLSFYDASWAAAARHWGLALISADRQLLAADLAESAIAAASRLGLSF